MQDNEPIGGFRRLSVIGAGAQAKVWKAQCVEDVHGIVPIGTVVALKVRYEHGDNLDAQWEKTFSRIDELKAMAHPNVVRYLGAFREKFLDHEEHVIVQEFLEGETLKERLEALNKWNPGKHRLGFDVDTGIDIISQVALGLGYTAGLGIFHRDVKPGNIFLCKDGTVKLIDFGVARQSDGTITEEGNIRGSWNYLAPDFADGVFRGDQQSDIFSVGVVLHEIITGRLPYQDACGDDTAAYFARWAKTVEESPIRIVSNTRRLLLGIDVVFDKTLSPDRNVRYRDFAQLKKALGCVKFVDQRHDGKTYRRVQFIGEGGFGEVFKARWLETNQPVAVKMLKNPDGAMRFHAEAKVMQELDDPCFTRFIDFFEEDGRSFLVMSFLPNMPGSSLRDAINRSKIEARMRGGAPTEGGLPKELVLSAFERYARGLSIMHRHRPRIIHRDIKPSNLYYPMNRPDDAAIMDFGIVRTGEALTADGLAPCTFDYAPPEIVMELNRGEPGMDIFALGLCLYEALTGKMGYPRVAGGQTGLVQFAERCRMRQPPVFDDPRVMEDGDLLRLLRRMTDPDVRRRLASADEVASEIRKLFYRDVESETSETRFFDANTDETVAIDDSRLKAWLTIWRKDHPIDEKQLMALYREEWQKEHEGRETPSVRKLPKPSRLKTPLLVLASVILTAAGVIAVLPQIEQRFPLGRSSSQNIDKQLVAAQIKSGRVMFEKAFDGLLATNAVEQRRECLAEAERRLQRVVGERVNPAVGWLYEHTSDEAARFRERLAVARRTAVCLVENRCGSKIEIDGRTVYQGERERIECAWTNVANIVITRFGYEPKNLPDDADGQMLVLTDQDFVLASVTVNLPEDVNDSVVCFFEGKRVYDAFRLKPRESAYTCVFKRHGYDDKERRFEVALGQDLRLDRLGEWVASPVAVTICDLSQGIRCEVDGKLVPQRLLLRPGVHSVRYVRHGYDSLEKSFTVSIGVGRALPAPSEIGSWKLAAVRIDIPYLEPGVKCWVDGHESSHGHVDLLPGRHTCRYERAGYVAQSNIVFSVELATPTNLPPPLKWVARKVPVTFPEIQGVEARLQGENVSGTILLAPGLHTVDYVATGKRQRVSFIVQINTPCKPPLPREEDWMRDSPKVKHKVGTSSVSQQARQAYAMALDYLDLETYGEALEWYHKAVKAGYPLTDRDLQNIERAYKAEDANVKRIIHGWEIRPKHPDIHRNIDKLKKQRMDLKQKLQEIMETYGRVP